MIPLEKDSLEARVIKLLGGGVVEKTALARELKVKESVLDVALKGLASRGLVGFDVLPDKVYVRLTGGGYTVEGVKPTQKRKLVRRKHERKPEEYEGMMYG